LAPSLYQFHDNGSFQSLSNRGEAMKKLPLAAAILLTALFSSAAMAKKVI
jgi:hypothetical protein